MFEISIRTLAVTYERVKKKKLLRKMGNRNARFCSSMMTFAYYSSKSIPVSRYFWKPEVDAVKWLKVKVISSYMNQFDLKIVEIQLFYLRIDGFWGGL
jgi:hypothetical protein